MKVREILIFSGETFRVPQNIQRIDHRSTHGWQLRYAGTRLFSDHSIDGSGAAASLAKATQELLHRIATLPAPSRLQQAPSQNKASGLPPGISGPVVRLRSGGRVRDCSLTVLIPRFGDKSLRRTVYIGTENTYTETRYAAALQRAIELRAEAEATYTAAATQAKRADAKAHVRASKQTDND